MVMNQRKLFVAEFIRICSFIHVIAQGGDNIINVWMPADIYMDINFGDD